MRGYSSYSFVLILRPNGDLGGKDHLLTKKFQWRNAMELIWNDLTDQKNTKIEQNILGVTSINEIKL